MARVWRRLLGKPDLVQHGVAAGERVFCGDAPGGGGLIRLCLAFRGGDEEAAYQVAKRFARFRLVTTGWPLRIPGPSVAPALREGVTWLLPRKDRHGRAMLVVNAGRIHPAGASVAEHQRATCFLLERLVQDEAAREAGLTLLVDLAGIRLLLFGLADVRRGMSMLQDALPCRLKRVWVLNAPAAAQALIRLATLCMKQKLRERVTVCGPGAAPEELAADAGLANLPPCVPGGGLRMDGVWPAVCADLCAESAHPEGTQHRNTSGHTTGP